MKFCKDCKWCVPDSSFSNKDLQFKYARCSNEKAAKIPSADMDYLVSGDDGFMSCSLVRKPLFDACNIEAKWFEEKLIEQVHMKEFKERGSCLRRIWHRIKSINWS